VAGGSVCHRGGVGIGVPRRSVQTPAALGGIHEDADRQHSDRFAARTFSGVGPDPGHSPGDAILGSAARRHALVGQTAAGAVDHFPDAGPGRLVRVYSARLEGALPVGTLTEVLAGLVIWIFGFLTLLQQVFEVDIRAILAALGVGGLAVALALQDTLSNLFAGFYVSVARQVRIGDFVKVDAGQSGYVQDIGWRSTTLRELGGNLIFIPNNKLSQSIVTNYHLPERSVGIGITVPVNYDADPSQVERLLTEVASAAIGQVPGLLKEPAPSARFIPGFGETSMNFTLGCHVAEYADQFLVQHELRKRIHHRLREAGVRFRSQGVPTRDLNLP
jgi:small-conductance mechanosensitive channel